MKAAVVFKKGELPKFVEDFEEPNISGDNDVLVSIKACAIKNLDKMRASGQHYSTINEEQKPKVVGGDGVGILADGTKIYGIGISGMLAEQAIVAKDKMVILPKNIDDATASALPNAVMGSAMALRFRAQLQKGETVIINGATGVTGKLAVQISKHYGAKKIIATGRNEKVLQELLALGADEIISLHIGNEEFIKKVKALHKETPIDIVIDYLWGNSAESILAALKGDGSFSHHTRYVTVGGMINDSINLSSSILRGTNIQISGSGLGSWSRHEMQLLITEILPEMFQLAANGVLKIETHQTDLKDIEKVWDMNIEAGKRLVVMV
ncbi:zinc-binding alcohol dehydrogenase family protein [Soonwooa sp.]|uniref:quinone oxidoreductase family protein n=1 Tax=Soonwooa sp. TaxID=1938592 RepID=UPI00262B381A|nr:zinc-binding alcohol dehydrogenase family protein [Soonwooa sp.]